MLVKKIYSLIYLLLIILIFFEDLIFVFLPASVSIVVRNFSDVAQLFLFILSLYFSLFTKSKYAKISIICILIIMCSVLSMLNQFWSGRCMDWTNYWAFIRFFLLFNILRFLKKDLQFYVDFVFKIINVCFFIQLIIGYLQIVLPDIFIPLFRPSYTQVELADNFIYTGGRNNEISGYFAHTIHYAYLMFLKILYIKSKEIKNKYDYVIVIAALIAIYFSEVMIVLLLALPFVAQILFPKFNWKIYIKYVPIIILIIWIFFGSQILDSEYVEGLLNTRLGLILYVYFPLLFRWESLLGYSSCAKSLEELVLSDPNLSVLPKSIVIYFAQLFEDVYYGAFILSFGVVALVLIFFLWYKVYKIRMKIFLMKNAISLDGLIRDLLIVMFLLNFVNQTLKVKTFSFVFWSLLFSYFYMYRSKVKSTLI